MNARQSLVASAMRSATACGATTIASWPEASSVGAAHLAVAVQAGTIAVEGTVGNYL